MWKLLWPGLAMPGYEFVQGFAAKVGTCAVRLCRPPNTMLRGVDGSNQRGFGRPGDRSDRQKVVHWPENVWFEVWYGNHFRFLATTNSTCIERDRVWTLVLMMVLESVVRGLNGKSGKAKMAFVCLRCGGGGGKISSSIVFHDFH